MPEQIIQDTTQLMMSSQEFSAKLEALGDHVAQADRHAREYFRRFPKVKSVSFNLGAMFILQIGLTLTWVRED
jgi:hypothetical protein